MSSPSVSGGLVFVGSEDNYIYALDQYTGALKWRYKTGDDVYSSPSVSGGLVFVGSDDNYIYALDQYTGALQWRYKTGDDVLSSPSVSGGNGLCRVLGQLYLCARPIYRGTAMAV